MVPSVAPASSTVIARNLRTALSAYARSTESGEVRELRGLALVNSGINYGVFNAAILFEGLRGGITEFEDLAGQASDYYAHHNLGWSCWVCPELAGQEAQENVPRILGSHGLRCIAEHQGMIAPSVKPPNRPLPALEIKRVMDAQTRLDFIHLTSHVFALPGRVARLIYGSERFWSGELIGWVGYADGAPVTSAASTSAAGVIGLYSIATLVERQRRGYGEKITRHALAQANRATGLERSVLQSTREGLPLYRKMGYQPAARFAVYATR